MHHHHHHHHHAAAAAAHHHYGHHHHGHHHGYKVPRVYFKIPRVLPYKEQREKFEADDFFKKLAREAEVRKKRCRLSSTACFTIMFWFNQKQVLFMVTLTYRIVKFGMLMHRMWDMLALFLHVFG